MTKALAVVGGIVLVLIIYHLWKTRNRADNAVANKNQPLGVAGVMVNRPKPTVVATMVETNNGEIGKPNPPQSILPQAQIGNGQIGTPAAPVSWNVTSANMASTIVAPVERQLVVCHGLYGQPLYHGQAPCKEGYATR